MDEGIMEITSKQRAYLRRLAANIDTIFQIGKGGVYEHMLRQISDALEARELIKLRVLDNSAYSAQQAMEEISAALHAVPVQSIGTRFVLFRPSEKKPRIDWKDAR